MPKRYADSAAYTLRKYKQSKVYIKALEEEAAIAKNVIANQGSIILTKDSLANDESKHSKIKLKAAKRTSRKLLFGLVIETVVIVVIITVAI